MQIPKDHCSVKDVPSLLQSPEFYPQLDEDKKNLLDDSILDLYEEKDFSFDIKSHLKPPIPQSPNYLDEDRQILFDDSPIPNLNEEQDFSLNIIPKLNSGLNLDEEEEEFGKREKSSPLFSISNKPTDIEDFNESKPLFIRKIENKKEEEKLPDYFKLDSCLKHFKVSVFGCLFWKINILADQCPELRSESSKSFKVPNAVTIDCDYIRNFDMLPVKIKDIITGKNFDISFWKKKDINNCQKNAKLIEIIEKGNSDISKSIKNLLDLDFEEAIKVFYDTSKFFTTFQESGLTKFYNDGFIKAKKQKLSLLDKYGFLEYIKFNSFPRAKIDQELLSKKRERI